jgi:hypothetical protein
LPRNARGAIKQAGIEADVEKRWAMDPAIGAKYDLLLSPALVIEGMVVVRGKVYKTKGIVELLCG